MTCARCSNLPGARKFLVEPSLVRRIRGLVALGGGGVIDETERPARTVAALIRVGAMDRHRVMDQQIARLGMNRDLVGEIVGGAVIGDPLRKSERRGAAV